MHPAVVIFGLGYRLGLLYFGQHLEAVSQFLTLFDRWVTRILHAEICICFDELFNISVFGGHRLSHFLNHQLHDGLVHVLNHFGVHRRYWQGIVNLKTLSFIIHLSENKVLLFGIVRVVLIILWSLIIARPNPFQQLEILSSQ